MKVEGKRRVLRKKNEEGGFVGGTVLTLLSGGGPNVVWMTGASNIHDRDSPDFEAAGNELRGQGPNSRRHGTNEFERLRTRLRTRFR